MRLVMVGDVHGKIPQLLEVYNSQPEDTLVFQLGDMGLGFEGVRLPHLGDRFKWIRGNHDDPAQCRSHPNYLGDCGYLPELKLFYLGGAYSIDRPWRVAGVSWWPDEELPFEDLTKAVALYEETKPEIVISHECPERINKILLHSIGLVNGHKIECAGSRTCQALQIMHEKWQPKHWYFGHYHVDKVIEKDGTWFQCVPELATARLNTGSALEPRQANAAATSSL